MSVARSRRVLITADAVGGVWQYSLDLASGLVPYQIDVVLAVLGPPPSTAQRALAETIPGVTLIETGLPLDWLARDAEELADAGAAIAQLAVKHDVDLVQLNSPALAAATRFPVPVVAVAHSCVATWWEAMRDDPLPTDFAWRTVLMRQGLAAADRVICPTRAFAEATKRSYALATLPTVVHNGRTKLKVKPSAVHDYAFTAGRLWDKGKNLATLDRVARQLAVPFHAAGPLQGPNGEYADLRHVHVLGRLEEAEIARWLAPRPVFVSAARYEPFGLAVVEAAAAGCPLVLSDISTFRELWDGAAVFVPADDDRAFAEAITDILGHSDVRLKLGQRARERAKDYTPQAMAEAMAAIYREFPSARTTPKAAARKPAKARVAA